MSASYCTHGALYLDPSGISATIHSVTPATDPAEPAPGWPCYEDILAARADRMAVMRGIVAGLTDADLGRPCQRSPAPGYPDEERTVIDCLGVVMNEEIEHYRFAVRDLAALEAT